VVATGIDHSMIKQQHQPGHAENALKELAGKIRGDSRRIAERIERAPTPQPAPQPIPAVATASTAAVESAAHAAVAAALLPTANDDVSIRPMPMKPSLFDAPADFVPPEAVTPRTFIPPPPERLASRAPRMPRIDELPLPAQNELKAQRGELIDDHPEKRRMSLMQRLAQVGLGRRETEPLPSAPHTAQTIPQFERPPQRPSARQPEGRPTSPVSEYARRSAPQGLDPHGRPAPVHNSPEDDQLDIPAFLRRQAN